MSQAHQPVLVAAPATGAVTLAEVKAHLRLEHPDSDSMITAIMDAAHSHFDGWYGVLGRALVTQDWAEKFSEFPPADVIPLAMRGVASVVSISYFDEDNVAQTFAATEYDLVSFPGGSVVICLKPTASWPSTYDRVDAVTVTVRAGYGAASAVPASIRQAMLLWIGSIFDAQRPDELSATNRTISALIAPHRHYRL